MRTADTGARPVDVSVHLAPRALTARPLLEVTMVSLSIFFYLCNVLYSVVSILFFSTQTRQTWRQRNLEYFYKRLLSRFVLWVTSIDITKNAWYGIDCDTYSC